MKGKSREVVKDSNEEEVQKEEKDKAEDNTREEVKDRGATLLAEWQDIASAVTRSLEQEEMEVKEEGPVAGSSSICLCVRAGGYKCLASW
ncbi:hypothetical protein H2248_001940 [Termitomyces sp. 'cryptogamus']|nr:hypothetical protein H2248_001940 [Termitomyces sp. 'cryptogamus']